MRPSTTIRTLGVLLIGGALAGATGSALAAAATTTFTVSATVLKTCQVSATNLNFGNYTPGGGAATSASTVGVTCTNMTPYTVYLSVGTTTGASFAQRLMANGSNTLQYNLYTSNAYTTVWGDTTGGTGDEAGTGAGLATTQNYTVYGQLPDSATNQTAAPLAYTDTITVTVNY